jgi:hypothetical protein
MSGGGHSEAAAAELHSRAEFQVPLPPAEFQVPGVEFSVTRSAVHVLKTRSSLLFFQPQYP